MRNLSLSLLACVGLAACSSSPQDGSTSTGTGGTSTSSSSTSSSSSGSGGSSSTSTGTGGETPFMPGQPTTATAEQWTWVPFDNAFCADGSTTGIGINPSNTGSRVLIYFEGGGACWDQLTCYTLMTASYFTTGYGAAEFDAESKDQTYLAQPGGFFDRSAAANPFKDYSYVYVPYCTGDIHAGNNVMTYGSHSAHHVGFKNVTAYLERIVPTFPTADRVIVAGSSAGGFGAAYNWWQAQQAFGSTRVDLIDDSGTAMPPDIQSKGMGEGALRASWNLAATLPPGCTQCEQGLVGLLPFYWQQFPTHRASLLSYIKDSVLPTFFGITTDEFAQGLNEDITMYFPDDKNAKYFTVNASGHVLWFSPTLTTGGVTVQQFITGMVNDDPAWASAHP